MTLTRQGLLAGLFATAALIALPVQAQVKLAAPASVGMSAERLKGVDQAMHGLVDRAGWPGSPRWSRATARSSTSTPMAFRT